MSAELRACAEALRALVLEYPAQTATVLRAKAVLATPAVQAALAHEGTVPKVCTCRTLTNQHGVGCPYRVEFLPAEGTPMFSREIRSRPRRRAGEGAGDRGHAPAHAWALGASNVVPVVQGPHRRHRRRPHRAPGEGVMYAMKRVCAECGEIYGHHFGERCPRQTTKFAPVLDGERALLIAVARAAKAFEDKVAALSPAITGAFCFQDNHGFPYRGDQWVHERAILTTALAALPPDLLAEKGTT